MIPHVKKGQPITKNWANALIDQANISGAFFCSEQSVSSGFMPTLAATPWQVHATRDGFILCPGPVYVNNMLVEGSPQMGLYVASKTGI